MAGSTASACDRVPSASSALAALVAQQRAHGVLASRLDLAAAQLPRRELDRMLVRPAVDFLARPGKGLREELVGLGWELGGGLGVAPAGLRAGVELLHAGSLIVDDMVRCAVPDASLARLDAAVERVKARLA